MKKLILTVLLLVELTDLASAVVAPPHVVVSTTISEDCKEA
jgi:hypothetical protein